jgi:hypothetical protein
LWKRDLYVGDSLFSRIMILSKGTTIAQATALPANENWQSCERKNAGRRHRMDDPVEIGKQIREERLKRWLSQRGAAELVGKSRAWVDCVEKGYWAKGRMIEPAKQKAFLSKLKALPLPPEHSKATAAALGQEIKRRRVALGIGQSALSKNWGYSGGRLWAYEYGRLEGNSKNYKGMIKEQLKMLDMLEQLEKEREKPMAQRATTSKTRTDELRAELLAKKAEDRETKEADPAYQVAVIETEIFNIDRERQKITARIAEIRKELSADEGLAVSFLVEGKRKLARELRGLEEDLVIVESPLVTLKARRGMLLKKMAKDKEEKLTQRIARIQQRGEQILRRFTSMANALQSDLREQQDEIESLKEQKADYLGAYVNG